MVQDLRLKNIPSLLEVDLLIDAPIGLEPVHAGCLSFRAVLV